MAPSATTMMEEEEVRMGKQGTLHSIHRTQNPFRGVD